MDLGIGGHARASGRGEEGEMAARADSAPFSAIQADFRKIQAPSSFSATLRCRPSGRHRNVAVTLYVDKIRKNKNPSKKQKMDPKIVKNRQK